MGKATTTKKPEARPTGEDALAEQIKRADVLQAALEGTRVVTLTFLPNGQLLRLVTDVNAADMGQLRALKTALMNVVGQADTSIDALFQSATAAAKKSEDKSAEKAA